MTDTPTRDYGKAMRPPRTLAQSFRLLMLARWSRSSDPEIAQAWGIAPAEIQHLSRSALRVAQVLDLPCTLHTDRRVTIRFDDGSYLTTNVLGSRFYDLG